MSVATLQPPQVRPPRLRPKSERLLTAADLDFLPTNINGNDVKYELYDGELVIMAPPGGEHGRRQHRIGRVLEIAEDLGLGVAFSEAGIVLGEGPDTLVAADAAFVFKASLPVKYTREGYLATIPEFVVEVKSKNDSVLEILSKCQRYFEAGVKVVWQIDPKKKTVLLAHADGREELLGINETLTCELLPGFSAAVATIFA
ncbi:Uma2 family endonuclease [soil metagenome]